MAGVIKAVGLMERIDARVGIEDQEGLTTGEAIAGRILNGVGCADRPMALTPQCVAHTPVGLLWRDGVSAEPCNRFTRGRSLAKALSSGCDTWCSAVALAGCPQARGGPTFPWLDPPSFSLPGASGPATDSQAMALTSGSATEHRPDVQHAVLAWMGAQEGGAVDAPALGRQGVGDRRVPSTLCGVADAGRGQCDPTGRER